MKYLKCFVALLFLFSMEINAYALALQDCVSKALANSDLIKAYENQVKAGIENYRKEQVGILPQPTLTSETNRFWYGNASDLPHLHGYMQRWSSGISIDMAKLIAYYPRLSHLELEKSRLLARLAENSIRKEISQEYYRLYVLLKKKKDYKDVEAYFADHIKDIEKLQSSGVDLKLDLGRAQVQQKSLRISLSNVNSEITNVLIFLNSLMNTDFNEYEVAPMTEPDLSTIKAGQPIFDENAPEENTPNSHIENIEKNYEKKLSDFNQTKLDAFDLKSAKESYRQSWFSYLPPIQLGSDHNVHPLDPAMENDRTFLSVSVNFLDFPEKFLESKRLKYTYKYQESIFRDNQRKLKVQIDQLITNIESMQSIYKNAVENLTSATQNIETAKTYFQQGKIKETDLLNVFSEYLTAKEQTYESLSDFLNKKAELDFVLEGVDL